MAMPAMIPAGHMGLLPVAQQSLGRSVLVLAFSGPLPALASRALDAAPALAVVALALVSGAGATSALLPAREGATVVVVAAAVEPALWSSLYVLAHAML